MQRIDTATAVAALPAPLATNAPGYFTRGNAGPGTPVPATNFDPDWCNGIQEELMSILAAAGIAADKTKTNQVLTAIQSLCRTRLTANTTFYVSATGSDVAGDGSNAAPWATIQHAVDTIFHNYAVGADITVTISVGSGTFGNTVITGQIPGQGNNPLTIVGNGSGNTTIGSFETSTAANVFLNGVTLTNPAGSGIQNYYGSSLTLGNDIVLGPFNNTGSNSALLCEYGAQLIASAGLTFHNCTTQNFLNCGQSGSMSIIGAVNFTGTNVASTAVVVCTLTASLNLAGVTAWNVTGTITGQRYVAFGLSGIYTGGQSATWIPGTAAGTTLDGSLYY